MILPLGTLDYIPSLLSFSILCNHFFALFSLTFSNKTFFTYSIFEHPLLIHCKYCSNKTIFYIYKLFCLLSCSLSPLIFLVLISIFKDKKDCIICYIHYKQSIKLMTRLKKLHLAYNKFSK